MSVLVDTPYQTGHGPFLFSSEVLALMYYNVPKNGKFKLSFTQPLTVNEGKILPLERAVKKWAPFSQSNVLPYLPKAEGSF